MRIVWIDNTGVKSPYVGLQVWVVWKIRAAGQHRHIDACTCIERLKQQAVSSGLHPRVERPGSGADGVACQILNARNGYGVVCIPGKQQA